MTVDRITTGVVVRDAGGTPFSPEYSDVYHSAASGPGQAAHVFLAGNDLPARWAGRRRFTVLETGFGLGVNFLTTVEAWRRDPRRPPRLHYIGIEKHPVARADLVAMTEGLAGAADLARAWPIPVAGLHRREFAGGGVVLTLAYADIERALERIAVAADAVYLDGFAPSRNPAMWSRGTMLALARCCAPDATFATYTAARAVRDALDEAGFDVALRPGYAGKRDMLSGRRRRASTPARDEPPPAQDPDGERHAIVVGAGVAGASAAWRLAVRGWRSTIVEAADRPARGASSILAGTFHPLIARDDSRLARLTRAGFLAALECWRDLGERGHPVAFDACGVLQLARRPEDDDGWAATIASLRLPEAYAVAVDPAGAYERCGVAVGRAGVWFAGSGWARAPSLAQAQIAAGRALGAVTLATGRRVAALRAADGAWTAIDNAGGAIARAPVVVLANAGDLTRLAPLGAPLRSVRGQASYLEVDAGCAPRAVIVGNGYVLPPVDGRVVAGASYDLESNDHGLDDASHAGNLARAAALLPGADITASARIVGGGVGFRAVAPDRMPIVGSLPAGWTPSARGPAVLSRRGLHAIGGFASRWLVWSAIAAETLASAIDGEPAPLEADLAGAIDPGRFLRRALRRGVVPEPAAFDPRPR